MCVLAAASSGGHDLEKLRADDAEPWQVVLRVLGAELFVACHPEAHHEQPSKEHAPCEFSMRLTDFAPWKKEIQRILYMIRLITQIISDYTILVGLYQITQIIS